MSAATETFMTEMVEAFPGLRPVLEEHLKDNFDEMLPHLLMSEVILWLVDNRDDTELCTSVISWLEKRFVDGPDDVSELIAVSGVEMIPDPGEPGAELRDRLGPALREVDPWVA